MDFARRTFSKGWVPDADNVNGPEDGLLRMDNLILDELGALGLRLGTAKINANAFADLDVHSLFTVFRNGLGGTRYRYAGAGDKVYRNGADIGVTFAGTSDIYFGSHLGQTLMARSTTKKKDDGTTVRNLGIAMTGGAPTAQAVLATNTKLLADWDAAEIALHTVQEDDGTGLSYNQDHAGVANGALVTKASAIGLRSSITKTFAADQDFSVYGAVAAADDDLLTAWLYVKTPQMVLSVTLMIDVNGGTFQDDYFHKVWTVAGSATPDPNAPIPSNPNDPGDNGGIPPAPVY